MEFFQIDFIIQPLNLTLPNVKFTVGDPIWLTSVRCSCMWSLSDGWDGREGGHAAAPLSRGLIIVSQADIPRSVTMPMLGGLSPLLFSLLHSQ